MPISKDEIRFVLWIEDTLVPDLKESGNDPTAEDFERLVSIIRKLADEAEKAPSSKKKK